MEFHGNNDTSSIVHHMTWSICVTVANDLCFDGLSIAWHRNLSFRWICRHAQQTCQAKAIIFYFDFHLNNVFHHILPMHLLLRSHLRAHTLAKIKAGKITRTCEYDERLKLRLKRVLILFSTVLCPWSIACHHIAGHRSPGFFLTAKTMGEIPHSERTFHLK